MECTKCKAKLESGDAAKVPFVRAYLEVLKDWRFWVIALVLTLAAGMTGGALNLFRSGFFALAGAAIGLIAYFRCRTVRKCPSCGAAFQSAPWLGSKKTG